MAQKPKIIYAYFGENRIAAWIVLSNLTSKAVHVIFYMFI